MRTKFKAWAEPYLNEHPEIQITLEDAPTINDVVLEIGSGKGQFLLDMALKYPDLSFIGVERNITCAGFTAKKLVENEISNAKLLKIDAALFIKDLKDESVNTIFLNFSDPWPKKKHSKRRLTAPTFLKEYARILKKDGKLIFKTDNPILYEFSLEMFANSDFYIISRDDNYDGNDPFDAQTEYEKSFREEGLPIYRLILGKKL